MYETKFDISQVADLLGIERITDGNSFGVVCPFCGDRRGKMNFRILKDGEPANTYHCYCCGEKGNMLTLYADLKGLWGTDRYKKAYREILEALDAVPNAPSERVRQKNSVPYREEVLAIRYIIRI